MLEKILVPLDGSELAERILLHVRRVLLRKDSEVILLRVAPETGATEADAARRYLEAIAGKLSAQGAHVTPRVVTGGDPAARLLELVSETRPSLVALSTHGSTGLRRFYRGSVAERVLRECRAPILLANPFALDRAPASLGFRRIYVPLDGSLESAQVLPIVHDLARAYESEVILAHVAEPETMQEAATMLEHYKKTLGGVEAWTLVERGAPAAAILDSAAREGADLIALTTHGRSGVSRWVYGSVAEHVLHHATVPLLVLRTR